MDKCNEIEKGCVRIQLNVDEFATCTFCRDRNPAKFRFSSTHPARNQVVYLCADCAEHIVQMVK